VHAAVVVGGFALLHALIVSPVLWRGWLLVEASDSAGYHYPAVYGPLSLWEPNQLCGYPRLADPQAMTWYPPAVLLRLTGAEWLWNPFILSAGVLASAFTYGLAHRLTGSRLGAWLAGATYGLGSFLTLHQPHVAVIHAAAWVPLVLWALAELRLHFHRGWFAALALGVALTVLGGHPQEGVYGLALAAVYAVAHVPGAPAGARSFGVSAACGAVLGLGLAALQLVPTAQLIHYSGRQAVGYETFTAGALPVRQLPLLLFPYVYGFGRGWLPHGLDEAARRAPYFGAWDLIEVSGFCGLLSLVLAVTALVAGRRTRGAWLWGLVAVGALLFALGDATPVAKVLFPVPLFNKFRCPARAFMTYELAVAVLAAHGVRWLSDLPRKAGALALGVGTAAVVAALAAAWWAVRGQMARGTFCPHGLPEEFAGSLLSPWPWVNPELGRPLLLCGAGLLALWGWWLRPGRVTAALLALVFVADVTQLGCFNLVGWQMRSDGGLLRRAPPALEAVRADLESSGERLLASDDTAVPTPGPRPEPDSVSGNRAVLWGLANAEGYTPLEVRRLRELLDSAGATRTAAELLGIRYRVGYEPPEEYMFGLSWEAHDFRPTPALVSPDRPEPARWTMPPTAATRLALLSALDGGTSVADGTIMAEVVVHTTGGDLPPIAVRAGEHTAERCHERPGVAHRRPALSLDRPGLAGMTLRRYLAVFPLGSRHEVTGLEVRLVGPSGPTLFLYRATLADDSTGECHPIREVMADDGLWRAMPPAAGSRLLVARNTRPLRRAWLAGRVVRMPAHRVRAVVLDGAPLPDGTPFEPYETALVEEPVPDGPTAGPPGGAVISAYEPCRVEVIAHAPAGGLLVLGDVNYPGWRATVDGRPAKVYQTDYVLRGVVVPPGDHRAEFRFRPTSFYVGLGLSGLSAVVLVGILVGPRRPGWRRTGETREVTGNEA
jgi:hypothetical protein